VRILPALKLDDQGEGAVKLDFAGSFNGAGWLTVGSTWYFRAGYRDPQGGGAGSNLSDALRVTFCD
jgi:hypothetical protein